MQFNPLKSSLVSRRPPMQVAAIPSYPGPENPQISGPQPQRVLFCPIGREFKEPWPGPGKLRYRIAAIGRGGQLVGAGEAELEGEVPDQGSIPDFVVRSMKVEVRRGEV